MELDHTHDPARVSWLASANEAATDFPIQNLPLAVFRRRSSGESFRGGVAIGDQVVDLAALASAGILDGAGADACNVCAQSALNDFMAGGPRLWRALRHGLFALLESSAEASSRQAVERCLVAQRDVEYALPARVANYTDFYTSFHHSYNTGRLFRPDNPVQPNFRWIPIAYHGRASSLVVSGEPVRRPCGQFIPAGAATPVFGPSERLDYELELGIFMGPGNRLGEAISVNQVRDHIFGMCLLNDWSARDIQMWEMAPLGPFLGKNFATSISPWIVTMDALAPYRVKWTRPADDPQPLAYLDAPQVRISGALDLHLEVWLETARQRAQGDSPVRLSATSFRHQYWTVDQMITHHASSGCNLLPGDLCGSGTISGPTPSEPGCMLELAKAGREPVELANGERRAFLDDGDAVTFKGWCEAPGRARIGFGTCRGEVLPALQSA